MAAGEALSDAPCFSSPQKSSFSVVTAKEETASISMRKMGNPQLPGSDPGPSGHSCFTKIRFASSLFSLFHVFAVVGFAKDIFVEKFGCDVTTVGSLFMVISFWTPLNQFIHGNLQDRQCLARFFPTASWGRRAQWLLTHVVIGAGASAAMFLPPGESQTLLYAWFFVMLFVANWGVSGSLLAFETARVELYPFKEERILVEGISKFVCMLGGGSGGVPMMILLVNATFAYRLGLSIFIFVMSLVSLWAVPVLKEAKAKSDVESLGGVMSVFAEALPWKNSNRAMQHLMALKFWHGAYGASIATSVLYYMTYVLQLSGWERNLVLGGAACTAGATEMICNSIYMWMFGTGDSRADKSGKSDRTLLQFVVVMRVLNAFLTLLIIGIAAPSVPLLFLWSVTSRICVCGFSFWKISSQCWLVDEDCHFGCQPGRRREGIIFGALNMIQNFAGAFFSSAVFIGLGLAGLKTQNCSAKCEGSAEVEDCASSCFTEVILSQPDSLRFFVCIVIGYWAPFCELMVAYHAWYFPIKGARLRKLNNAVRQSRGEDIAADDKIAAAPCTGRGRVEQMAAHRAVSKMGVHIGEHSEGDSKILLRNLAHVIAFTADRPGPKSMAVFFEWGDGRSMSFDSQSTVRSGAAFATGEENAEEESATTTV